ncbi:hypothetical protein NGC36_17755 [Serratia rubidaea]|uniref:Uncharacterized protein n=1 Tax=Serratia rubidaea TaxID=61652 RepID=A0ABS0M977_SERRU|nr:hypothetical protein [Serratia rubidaea]MBH1928921.1 hypothetical protein [Serratia rubidaea]MEB7587115.1 hypothetical protein [Serratia rubidaea]
MFKTVALFAICFLASFLVLNKVPLLKELVDSTVIMLGDWMNEAGIAKTDGERDPAFLPVVLGYLLITAALLMSAIRWSIRKFKR